MTLVSNGGTTTLGLYDTQSQLAKKADITYVDNKVDALIGGHKGFATLALAQAAQGTLPSGSVVEVTNDATASNNGLYLWNGTTLTKSAYDPLTQAKTYTNITALLSADTDSNLSQYQAGSSAYVLSENAIYKTVDTASLALQDEYTSLKLRMLTQPNAQEERALNYLIYRLKQAGIWNKLDGLWLGISTSKDDAKLNLKQNTYNLVESGTLGWSKEFGFSFPAATNTYLDTGINPSAIVGNLKLNDISVGVRVASSQLDGMTLMRSAHTDGTSILSLSTPPASGGAFSLYARANQFDPSITNVGALSSAKTLVVSRSLANEVKTYVDGNVASTSAISSVKLPNVSIVFGNRNVFNQLFNLRFAFIASSITDTEQKVLSDVFNDYRDIFINNDAKTATLKQTELSDKSHVLSTVTNAVETAINSVELQVGQIDTRVTTLEGQVATLDPSGQALELSALNSFVFNGEKGVAATTTLTGTIDDTIINQEYLGGYVEIQPDSYIAGSPTATDSSTQAWGFPQSLTQSEQSRLRKDFFRGDGKGIRYIRFPLGYAYRGYRNIDPVSGLAQNIGERYKGQNAALRRLFSNIAKAGGGLAPEYWCPPVHWLTSGSYIGSNLISAGGSYPRSTALSSIRLSDPTQYAAQIDAFTNAIVTDVEYLHQNIAPVRMYGLQNEPGYSTQEYGACFYDAQTYSDVLLALHPKIIASQILSEWDGEPNKVLLHVASDDHDPYWSRADSVIAQHPEWIWGYSFHPITKVNGEANAGTTDFAADWLRSAEFTTAKGSKQNVFLNEFEYFQPSMFPNEFKCANNMLHLINSAIYAGAKVFMPIIHVCKQLGATSATTNTEGYALVQCNLQEQYGLAPNSVENTANMSYGSYRPVAHNYNAWKMFNDNLPIGAVRVGGTPTNRVDRVNYVAYKFEGKLYIFMANSSTSAVNISLTFNASKSFNGKQYSISEVGSQLKSKVGTIIQSTVPARSGQVWIEK